MAQVIPTPLAPEPTTRVDVRFVDLVVAMGGALLGVIGALIAVAIFAKLDRPGYEKNAVPVLLVATIIIYAGLFLGMLRFLRRLPDDRLCLGLRHPGGADFGMEAGLLLLWYVCAGLIAPAVPTRPCTGTP